MRVEHPRLCQQAQVQSKLSRFVSPIDQENGTPHATDRRKKRIGTALSRRLI
jgi:hypothetical protein